MTILVFLSNNPLGVVLGLIGIGLVIASTILSNIPKPERLPVRVENFHRKQ